jgi:septum formation protein
LVLSKVDESLSYLNISKQKKLPLQSRKKFMNIILGSASPRRAELFKQMNLTFSIDPSNIEETIDHSLTPENLVVSLASQKGSDVSQRHKNSLVIAADTLVWLNEEILGKPSDELEAKSMLRNLSNKTHDVYSGVWAGLMNEKGKVNESFSFSERTKVTFSALTEEEIDFYVATGSPMDKAGAYGIQDDYGALFVQQINGDYYNVVGFPINAFYQNLRRYMPKIHTSLFLNQHA